MAHYDSVAAGPGAADDMSGVATILETVRALRAGPPLRNDVTVVLTDGEEAGLHGARAWVREQLAPDRPTVVLNWEARGVEGPSLLFETSPGNAGLDRGLGRESCPHPRGDSSQVEVYRFLPNDTDLSPVLDAGRPGMNAAFIERRVPVPHPRRRAREPQPRLGAEPRRQRPRADAGPGGAGPRPAGPRGFRRARHR